MDKNAKHIQLVDGSKHLYNTIQTACELLNVHIQCAVKAIINPSKRPFNTLQWTLIVRNEDYETVEELLLLIAPSIKYSSKDGYFVERRQRKGPRKII